jgi:hypothetical protein
VGPDFHCHVNLKQNPCPVGIRLMEIMGKIKNLISLVGTAVTPVDFETTREHA